MKPPERVGPTFALHLVPGVLTTAGFVVLAPILMANGFPALFALLLATALVLIPFELGYLVYRARLAPTSRLGVVGFREPVPPRQYVAWTLLLVVWALTSSVLASPLDRQLLGLFSWLPDWYFAPSLDELASYSPAVLRSTFVLGLVVSGFAGPIVEELYFRGHLLPRLARFGRWAPLLHAILFSLYHFWTPWQNPSRLLLSVAMSYVAWHKRNIYIVMLAHGALNAVVWTVMFGAILRARP